jgi:hypothetical protein
MTPKSPLYGEKTHPLTSVAYAALERLSRGPEPQYRLNPGLRNRLLREDLVERFAQPISGLYPGPVPHLRITDAGRAALAARPSKAGAKR